MWAADVSHVNYLQFPNADRLGFQEKLNRREARHAGRKGFRGSPSFQTRGCLGVCLSHPDQAGGSCFWGGGTPKFSRTDTKEGHFHRRSLTLHDGVRVRAARA